MSKGVIRIQKGLLMIEALVKSKDLTPEQKLEDIQYCIDKIWNNEGETNSKFGSRCSSLESIQTWAFKT